MDSNDKDRLHKRGPKVANGIDNGEELDADATNAEIENGDYTKVTKLVWDEYDPSGKED